MRCLTLILAVCVLSACARNVTLQNPRTGESVICRQSLGGLNPWSQTDACIAGFVAQGWVPATAE